MISEEMSVAIVGMSCRLPGGDSPNQFWHMLDQQQTAVGRVTLRESLNEPSVSPKRLRDPAYVAARARIQNPAMFDAAYFGINLAEARITDPQHRLLLELAATTIVSAGYETATQDQSVGVFAGCSTSSYWHENLLPRHELREDPGDLALRLANDRDFVASRISYRLGLNGPAVGVSTACSTSLVAMHLAVSSLLEMECDLALVGAATVTSPLAEGYSAPAGSILSPDGRCSPFRRTSRGAVPGDGGAMFLLRRLADVDPSDPVLAVIRGSAVNNDGADKAGFTAPSPTAQRAVIAEALSVANVEAHTVDYVEAHGTGTPIGDPIELSTLAELYGRGRENAVIVGSVKANVGHLDAAAGAAGLVKLVQMFANKRIPGMPRDDDLESRPIPGAQLSLALESTEWPDRGVPRRAAISSFGMGGTNAHVVLEQPPSRAEVAQPTSVGTATLRLSAKSTAALRHQVRAIGDLAGETSPSELADALVHRRDWPYRAAVCVRTRDELRGWATLTERSLDVAAAPSSSRSVVLVLPGQGSERPQMGLDLCRTETEFAEPFHTALDAAARQLRAVEAQGLWTQDAGWTRLDEGTLFVQIALFVTQYASVRYLQSTGLRAAAMVGHSVGEWAAAVLGGVLSLEDAAAGIVLRGRLMGGALPGAMLAVSLSAEDAARFGGPSVVVAADNSPGAAVLAGDVSAIEVLEKRARDEGVGFRRLAVPHAFHSPAMSTPAESLGAALRGLQAQRPTIAIASTLTGSWAEPGVFGAATYWAEELRSPVRFREAIQTTTRLERPVLVEVGHGSLLAALKQTAGAHVDVRPMGIGGDDEVKECHGLWGWLWSLGAHLPPRGQTRPRHVLDLPIFDPEYLWVDAPGADWVPSPARTLDSTALATNRDVDQDILGLVTRLLADAVGRTTVGIDDDFFAMGGDSLVASRVVSRLRTQHGIDLVEPSDLFDNASPRALAGLLEQRMTAILDSQ